MMSKISAIWPIYLLCFSCLLPSCVGSKKYKKSLEDNTVLNNKLTQLQSDLKSCEDDKMKLGGSLSAMESLNSSQKIELKGLQDQVGLLKDNNNQVMGRLQDMSVLTGKQAESIGKSLDKLAERDIYIKDLQGAMARKDSLNMSLVMNLKGAISDVSNDIEVKVEKGVVFVSISDKLLFTTGKYDVSPRAKEVLGKVAQVLNKQPNVEFMVEGHTDDSPIKGGTVKDNWDLSVLRATSVVRILQKDYGLDPRRMTAGGRAEYFPVQSNDTPEGKAANRRTRIVILPQLDQFFQLMEPEKTATKPGEG